MEFRKTIVTATKFLFMKTWSKQLFVDTGKKAQEAARFKYS